jgi:TolB protein
VETFDQRVRTELERLSPPADPSGVVDHVLRRGARRHAARRAGTVLVAFAVFAGSIGGFYALTRVFRQDEDPPPIATTPTVSNGLIVFSIPLEGEGQTLMAVAPDGSGLRRLSPEGRVNYRLPDVSPDGTTVVAVYETNDPDEGVPVLVTFPISGGTPTWLTDILWSATDPAWSPDGSRIAFVGRGGPFGLYVLELASGEKTFVPGTDELEVSDPTWSPDGRRIAFAGSVDADPGPSQTWDIYSVGLDGTGLRNLTNSASDSESAPSWSWVNDRIAFVRGDEALSTISADGTDERLVFDDLPTLGSPAWSPDGARIAFSADTGQVYTIREDGTDLQPVTGALGEVAWQALPEGATIAPVPTPSPSETPSPTDGVGLGFPVCNVSSIDAAFAVPDQLATAFVATRRGDVGGCPDPQDAFNVIALDVDRDGLADASFGPIVCEFECRTFSAPDLDGDGTSELLVAQAGGAVLGLGLYEVETSDAGTVILPVTVAPPGDPEGEFDPGSEIRLLLGGDEFFHYSLRCGDPQMRNGPGLIVTAAESLPHDSPNARWHAHETTFALVDGSLRVMDIGDYTEPAGFDPPSFQSGETLCGSNLGP